MGNGMWKFWAKPGSGHLPEEVKYALARERGVDQATMAGLRMVQERGVYAMRKVTLFRLYDPEALKARGIVCKQFRDLDSAGALYEGHIEAEGHVVLGGRR